MITLYGFGSPNVLKIVIALEEMALPWRFEMVDMFRGEQFTDDFGALTPNRKVPVIVDEQGVGGRAVTLWESGAILIYLMEKTGRFLPAGVHARLAMLQWLMWQMGGVGPMFGQLAHFRLYATDPDHAYARARYATEVKRLYDVAERRLGETPFLGGEDYGLADMAAWPWFHRWESRGVDITALPAVRRWIEAIAARPAVQRAKAFFDPLAPADIDREMRDNGEGVDRYVQRGRWSRPEL
ncbi:glutathione S-transferase C-terminal domain-containing protein [Sphingobium sp.]|uniref:glutathione S-transferase family protein n=1 Tax=Sphingobium sp. TaxID=1912891 RepID=UPI0028BF56D6|nr:glutathione S-transferase C-terminal domain-containing protein [Sphingobium sp.]